MTNLTIKTSEKTMNFDCDQNQFRTWLNWYASQNATITTKDGLTMTCELALKYAHTIFYADGLTITVNN